MPQISTRVPLSGGLGRMLFRRLLFFFSILGPGIIAANADNDASGIFGYSLAGVQYRYAMLWVLVISTVALGVAQEICARMGAVTGKGLADLIREQFGVKITVFAMLTLLIANFATTVSEFAGILAAVQLFVNPVVSRLIVLPLVAVMVWLLVTRGSYRRLEKVLLAASGVYLLYIVSAFLSHPDWGQVMKETVMPNLRSIGPVKDYVFMIINVVGTTITPWGQFYIQSSVRDRGVKASEYKHTQIDVLFGAFFTNFIAFFIIVCCGAKLFGVLHDVNDAGQVAEALKPLAGTGAAVIFAIGLFNASCFGAITVPLSTAYAVAESLGTEAAVGRRGRESQLFVGVFTFMIITALLTVVFFPSHLSFLILLPNVVGAVLLPIILILMLKLVNDKSLMGEFTNGRIYNLIAWTTTVVLITLSVILLITNLMPHS